MSRPSASTDDGVRPTVRLEDGSADTWRADERPPFVASRGRGSLRRTSCILALVLNLSVMLLSVAVLARRRTSTAPSGSAGWALHKYTVNVRAGTGLAVQRFFVEHGLCEHVHMSLTTCTCTCR